MLDDDWTDLTSIRPASVSTEPLVSELEEAWAVAKGQDRQVYLYGWSQGPGDNVLPQSVVEARVIRPLGDGQLLLITERVVWVWPGEDVSLTNGPGTTYMQSECQCFPDLDAAIEAVQSRLHGVLQSVRNQVANLDQQIEKLSRQRSEMARELTKLAKPVDWDLGRCVEPRDP